MAAELTHVGNRRTRIVIAVIVLAQWFGTSLWFSPSGAADGISAWLDLGPGGFGLLIAATQCGFIVGSIACASTGASDRFPPSVIFAVAGVLGAAFNTVWILLPPDALVAWIARFGVGATLAGVYPIGMKMVVTRVGGSAGMALGWLVAMLTLGTAMPHVLRAIGAALPWQAVLGGSSVLAVVAALAVLAVGWEESRRRAHVDPAPEVPVTARAPSTSDATGGLRTVLGSREYRAAALGYAGHMWELYAFWAVVPVLVVAVLPGVAGPGQVAAVSAAVIGVGAVGSTLGGALSGRWGSHRIAAGALAGSGLVCLVYPLLPDGAAALKIAALLVWGVLVIADSPQFSALASAHVPAESTGVALTAMNALGFFVTVVSIVILQALVAAWGEIALWLLLPGPALGLLAMRPLWARTGRIADGGGGREQRT